ncbi:DUF2791 family P-loop domain-containing protein [Streptomyces sp. NBC_01336]|uniref:BREX system ATP-binding domain-containing protein n=1 Tax=Streptomyces sp. NBC_01336 TaxID=2903829 RepID=UPI002E0EA30B|nr:DUF2791 family P-loop domain-containing protein [Streptomyces sp. NBC_01336]
MIHAHAPNRPLAEHSGTESGEGPVTLYGRDAEIAMLDRLLDRVQQGEGAVLAVAGAAGSGKSALLNSVCDHAAQHSMTVLRTAGHEPGIHLPFEALGRLLLPLLASPHHADRDTVHALRTALEAAARPGARLEVALATWRLLTNHTARTPVIAVIDDARWLDRPTADVLAFLARRINRARVLLLTTDDHRADGRDQDEKGGLPRLHLRELDEEAAGALLDSLPQPPDPVHRPLVLQQAAGNPLALHELTRAVTHEPPVTLEPTFILPLPPALQRIHGARLPALDADVRQALLVAAAAGDLDRAAVMPAAHRGAASAGRPPGPEIWQPAEEAGLVTVTDGKVHFRHPLVRSAVYRAASFASRRTAHLALATALDGHPDRQAWHRAAAAVGTDEQIAQELVATADRACRRGGYRGASAAMRRAAELTPQASSRTHRLLRAAEFAMFAGLPAQVADIATQALASSDDPQSLGTASIQAGWALAVTTRHAASLGLLLPAADALRTTDPQEALAALSTATTVVYHSGDPRPRRESLRLGSLIAANTDHVADRLWARAGCDPFEDRPLFMRLLAKGLASPEPDLPHLVTLGAGAWIIDETRTSTQLLGLAHDHLQRITTKGANATLSTALGLAQYEIGAWQAARATSSEAHRVALESGLALAAASSWSLVALLDAVQGDGARARTRLTEAMAGIEPAETRAMAVRARIVLATAATTEGDHGGAWEQLRGLFSSDAHCMALHYHASFYAIADLAAAAARVGRRDEARQVLEAVEQHLAGRESLRLTLLLHRARALLSGPQPAEKHFLASLADPAGDQWPFERAKARLEYGEWLRRGRRINDARPVLADALAVFEQLGARPWTTRCVVELRACGVVPHHTDRQSAGRGAGLTAQQLNIARLAADGLSNREIGEQLLLSPRTIAFHLYHAFPKLDVTTRSQLRNALSRLDEEAGQTQYAQ